MIPSHNPEDRIVTLEQEFTRPPDTFLGEEWWPLTRASFNYFLKATAGHITPGENARFYWFIHRKRGGKTFEEDSRNFALLLYSDMPAFIAGANAQADELDDEADETLKLLVGEILGREADSRAKIGPKAARAVGMIKKKETTRPTSRGKRRRSRSGSA